MATLLEVSIDGWEGEVGRAGGASTGWESPQGSPDRLAHRQQVGEDVYSFEDLRTSKQSVELYL